MLHSERGDAIVNLAPHFVGGYRAEFAAGDFDSQIQFATMTDLHDDGIGLRASGKKVRDKLDRLLRGRQADAREAFTGQVIETFERQR